MPILMFHLAPVETDGKIGQSLVQFQGSITWTPDTRSPDIYESRPKHPGKDKYYQPQLVPSVGRSFLRFINM